MFSRALLAVLLACASAMHGAPRHGRLPLESVTAAQGLPNDSISTIVTDSRGYVWFGTLDGLSRYDGNRFVNYGTDDGLPDRMVWTIVEDHRGAIWVGTSATAAAITPESTRGRSLFARVATPPNKPVDASAVYIDRKGTVWTQCDADLCTVRNGRFEVDQSFRKFGGRGVHAIAESPSGELWVGTEYGLLQRRLDGSWRHYDVQPHRGADIIHGFLWDAEGRIWMSTGFGVFIFLPPDDDSDTRSLAERAGKPLLPGQKLRMPARGEVVGITVPYPSPIIRPTTPFQDRNGVVWFPCYIGLLRIGAGAIDFFDAKDGLPPLEITAVGEDPSGDIWIGTRGAGALRLARSGATTFNRTDGLANERIMSLFELDDGTMCATNRKGLSCFDANGEIHHASLWPRTNQFPGWGWNQIVVRDPDGSLLFATGEGIVRWPRVARIEDLGRIDPLKTYTMRDGLGSDDIFRIWRDSRGALWVGTFGKKELSRLDRGATRFVSYGEEDGFVYAAPTSFAEDRAGNVWIGLYIGGLMRFSNGHFDHITRGIPVGFVRDLKIDSRGELWVATNDGLARIEDPTRPAHELQITRFSRRDGLASDSGYCLTELPGERMAIGSQRGLDVFNPATKSATHITTREGLASNEVSVAKLDRNGALWLGTVNGLSRFRSIPAPRVLPPPHVRIEYVEVDGVPTPVPELGASSVENLRIEYPRHTMAVRFSAPHYDPARPLRFEYRIGKRGLWVEAETRTIVFDRLPAGSSVFEVRASSSDGSVTSSPARLSFVVIPPLWKRTWFISLALAAAVALALLAHRARVAHLIALERVRTRVATDLHDDLGSSLSRISILSEVAKRKLGDADPAPVLDEIADSARGLVDALGDSIWSIDPRRDDVQSLLQRARHFAAAVFESQSIAIDVRVPPDVAAIPLGPEQRRETYLILKEALNNAAKHAEARHVAVVASAEDRVLRIAVKDDGKGFVSRNGDRENGGRGVPSMIDRARRVGGRLDIESQPGGGTSVSIAVPL